jgi:hypothetical protein
VANRLSPPAEAPPPAQAFEPLLNEEMGHFILSRRTVALVFGGFLAGGLALGALLRKGRPGALGWLGPGAALGAAAAVLALGAWERRGAAPTVAVVQVVHASPAPGEASAHGHLAMYTPAAGPAEVGASRGGFFDLDLTGSQGQARRWVMTDTGRWHWDGLSLPAGARRAPFRATIPLEAPLEASAGFGPDGLEGHWSAGPFEGVADAFLRTPNGRNLAVRLRPDGTFRAAGADALLEGQFLTEAVLSDRQQRQQALLREMLKRPKGRQRDERLFFLAWARPVDLGFTLAPGARLAGTALLVVPLRLKRPSPGTKVTIPGPLLTCRRVVTGGLAQVTVEGAQGTEMPLRFQLPAEVLPLEVERARLHARVEAPGREVTIWGGPEGGERAQLYRTTSPQGPFTAEVEGRLLRPGPDGGLYLSLSVSEPRGGQTKGKKAEARPDEKWAIRYLELEVTGRAAGER